MDDKEIDKIVKLVKDGKITVSNDTLAFTKDYVKKQNKRTISGPSHEKGINYLSKNLKLSDKVSFYCTKSGKLTLRGGKDAAKDLRHDIKVSELVRQGELFILQFLVCWIFILLI